MSVYNIHADRLQLVFVAYVHHMSLASIVR